MFKYKQGFTLIETALVVFIIAVMAILAFPVGVRFYKTQDLDSVCEGVLETLRRAQLKAMSVENDSAFGVYLGTGKTGYYSLFRGSSYEHKEDEEIFDISENISFGGTLQEVVFSKLEGIPGSTGDIILTLNGDTETININELGRVNLK